jgi:hypothetical protein
MAVNTNNEEAAECQTNLISDGEEREIRAEQW